MNKKMKLMQIILRIICISFLLWLEAWLSAQSVRSQKTTRYAGAHRLLYKKITFPLE